jgi:hypothetical protein
MSFYLSELIRDVRERCGRYQYAEEEGDTPEFSPASDSAFARYINDAQTDIAQKIVNETFGATLKTCRGWFYRVREIQAFEQDMFEMPEDLGFPLGVACTAESNWFEHRRGVGGATPYGSVEIRGNNFRIQGVAAGQSRWLHYLSNLRRMMIQGEVASATSSTLTPGSLLYGYPFSDRTNYYKDLSLKIISGTGANQKRRITAYNGDTLQFTVSPVWSVNPSTDSVFATLSDLPSFTDELFIYESMRRYPDAPESDQFNSLLSGLMKNGLMNALVRLGHQ